MVMDRDHLHGSLGDGVGEHLPRVYRGGPRSQSGVGSLPLGGQEPLLRIAVACVEVEARQHAGGQSGQGADVRAFGVGAAGQGLLASSMGDAGHPEVAAGSAPLERNHSEC